VGIFCVLFIVMWDIAYEVSTLACACFVCFFITVFHEWPVVILQHVSGVAPVVYEPYAAVLREVGKLMGDTQRFRTYLVVCEAAADDFTTFATEHFGPHLGIGVLFILEISALLTIINVYSVITGRMFARRQYLPPTIPDSDTECDSEEDVMFEGYFITPSSPVKRGGSTHARQSVRLRAKRVRSFRLE
jgi:hypothetical protein